MLQGQRRSRGVEAARLPSRQWGTWVLYLVKCCLGSCLSCWTLPPCVLGTSHYINFFKTLSHRNDLLLSGICVQRANTEHFHHHSKNPEEGDGYQECDTALWDVPHPAWIPPATQQPSTGVYQICLPGILPSTGTYKALFVLWWTDAPSNSIFCPFRSFYWMPTWRTRWTSWRETSCVSWTSESFQRKPSSVTPATPTSCQRSSATTAISAVTSTSARTRL